MKPADLLRRLRRLATKKGWNLTITDGGSHTKLRLNGRPAVLPRHAVDLKPGTLRAILDEAGPVFQNHDPGTWPEQAALLMTGRWAEFKSLTDRLDGGVLKSGGGGET